MAPHGFLGQVQSPSPRVLLKGGVWPVPQSGARLLKGSTCDPGHGSVCLTANQARGQKTGMAHVWILGLSELRILTLAPLLRELGGLLPV